MRSPQTFVIKLLPPDSPSCCDGAASPSAESDQQAPLHGRITHVGSGDSTTFASLEQLLVFLLRYPGIQSAANIGAGETPSASAGTQPSTTSG